MFLEYISTKKTPSATFSERVWRQKHEKNGVFEYISTRRTPSVRLERVCRHKHENKKTEVSNIYQRRGPISYVKRTLLKKNRVPRIYISEEEPHQLRLAGCREYISTRRPSALFSERITRKNKNGCLEYRSTRRTHQLRFANAFEDKNSNNKKRGVSIYATTMTPSATFSDKHTKKKRGVLNI